MTNQGSSIIAGTGSFLPPHIVGNVEVAQHLGLSAEYVFEVTGIRNRRWVREGETCSELAAQAARRAIQSAGLAPSDIDVILVSTTSPDTIFPSTACHLQRCLGIRGVAAFDLSASCSGFLYGLSLANSFIRSGQYTRCLVVASEVKSRYLDSQDGASRLLFGDGAGAVVVVRADTPHGSSSGIQAIRLYSDGAYHHLVTIPAGGSRLPSTSETIHHHLHGIQITGGVLFRVAVKRLEAAVKNLLKEFNLNLSDIQHVITHQANGRILAALAKRLALPKEKMFSVIEDFGNTSSASLPIALDCAYRQGKFGSGDLIVLGAFGGGLTWGAGLIRW